MLIRTHEDAENDAVEDDKWISRRYTLRADGMGHSLHETYIKPGKELHMWYKNHKETVLCIEGEGKIQDLTEGGEWELKPGVLYALDKHQQHILSSEKRHDRDLCLLAVAGRPGIARRTRQLSVAGRRRFRYPTLAPARGGFAASPCAARRCLYAYNLAGPRPDLRHMQSVWSLLLSG